MPLSELISSAASNVFLNTDGLAREIVRWPKGNQVYAQTIGAIFVAAPTQKIETHGVSYSTKGTLKLAASQEWHLTDKYLIDGDTWTIEARGRSVGGLANFKLTLHERGITKQRN
jgi:hypothetical protein